MPFPIVFEVLSFASPWGSDCRQFANMFLWLQGVALFHGTDFWHSWLSLQRESGSTIMTPELKYLAMISVFTALMWIPYILNAASNNKLGDLVGYPQTPLNMSPWAERLKKAHSNAVENLVVFAAVVLIANALEISNVATVSAAAAYFWGRLVHAVAYTAAVPWLRTLAFAVAWGGILCISWQILG
jgi:uncharacterized MAPEG superfamily protein